MKDNIIKTCNDLGIDSSSYIEEIFGKRVGEKKVRGLIDCYIKEEFERKYKILSENWFSRKNGE